MSLLPPARVAQIRSTLRGRLSDGEVDTSSGGALSVWRSALTGTVKCACGRCVYNPARFAHVHLDLKELAAASCLENGEKGKKESKRKAKAV
eukprot:scaffold1596_cov302-Pinguiococcus_pyrenoidosus.AAC.1